MTGDFQKNQTKLNCWFRTRTFVCTVLQYTVLYVYSTVHNVRVRNQQFNFIPCTPYLCATCEVRKKANHTSHPTNIVHLNVRVQNHFKIVHTCTTYRNSTLYKCTAHCTTISYTHFIHRTLIRTSAKPFHSFISYKSL